MSLIFLQFLVTRNEILELESPFGCGSSPLFTYPFFGEDQLISLRIPSDTPESVMESLEIVLCIESSLRRGRECFLGVSEGKILGEARLTIEKKLTEMFEAIGSSIKFYHSWTEYQTVLKAKVDKVEDYYNSIDENVYKLMKPGEKGEFYDRFQVLLPFFIEAATPIDSSDPKWTIYLNILDKKEGERRLIGLLTTYSYFKFPEGLRVRISQVLIFPRDQGNRLGSRLYQTIVRSLRSDPECQEICVEDPTDGFERIRGLIDWREASEAGIFENDNDLMVVRDLTEKMKMNSEQAQRILNLNKSLLLHRTVQETKRPKTSSASASLDPATALRQQIKRWLLGRFRKDLPEDKVERIKKLGELYESEMEEFIEPIIEILEA